ncbi:MAG: flagellin lysine-N-methylase [Oscillospiraceae bacterium]|nr:flagellin lysine-N-methylase [Oscillospiraceae bacterium]
MSKTKVSAQFYRQPRYYNSFSCIGGSCPMSCCLIWRVDWTRDEVEKLKNTECSEHLRELINSSFKENGEKYMIQMDEKRRCPFLTEDNFCSIQRELGAEYLSHVCTVYPRNSRLNGNNILNYCNLSCYHIMDTLCNDKNCMILENYRFTAKKSGRATIDNEIDTLNHPELKYRQQLFEFFYEIISDESHSVETSITLGALAAQSISKLIGKGAYDKIPDSISALKKQLNNPEQLKKLEDIKPNYAVKFGFLNELNKIIIKSNIIDMISENGAISIDKYNSGMEKFRSDFAERPFALRNIALNLLLECKMPFRDKNCGFFENYCYYAAAFAAIKLVAAAIYTSINNPERGFKSSSAYISRYFAHDDFKVKQILDVFKELNCMSPAYIALIIN